MAARHPKVFDPYHDWLDIADGPRPPDYFTLLGLPIDESDPDVIRAAARQRIKRVRPNCLKYPEEGTRLLNEITAAQVCLCDPQSAAAYREALAGPSVPLAATAPAFRPPIPRRATLPVFVVETDARADGVPPRSSPTGRGAAAHQRSTAAADEYLGPPPLFNRSPLVAASVCGAGLMLLAFLLVGLVPRSETPRPVVVGHDAGGGPRMPEPAPDTRKEEPANHPPEKPKEVPSQRKAGELTRVTIPPGVEMTFAWCPAGTFVMGSPPDEEERLDSETPHRVTLTQGYWLGIHEVTQAQWQAVMGDNPSSFRGDNLPVEWVSWDDCQAFCQKLGEKTGQRFRLPTEAEWEYACRAGTTTPFHFGETISTEQANYNSKYTYGRGQKGEYRAKTTPVGSFPANAWGLYDMHGNVYEWCQDRHGDYLLGDIKDPQGPPNGSARVLRGGSWDNDPRYCRAAYRNRVDPGHRLVGFGCRVLLCLD